MTSWPKTWISRTLEAAGIPVGSETIAVMRAWKDSTPLPPYTNNPVGMPHHFARVPRYMNTDYGMYVSFGKFLDAVTAWSKTGPGRKVIHAITSDSPYAASWREIAALGWPGSATETEYPSRILDLTEQSYRDSVSATPRAERKTSGTVGEHAASKSEVMAHARSLSSMYRTMQDSNSALNAVIRRNM
jgi:hypothetical protein